MVAKAMRQNTRGDWVPAVPLPLVYGPVKVCDCRAWFLRTKSYRGHFAYVHIVEGR